MIFSPNSYKRYLRPLLFRLPPETAQKLADQALKQGYVWRALAPRLKVEDERLRVRLAGIDLPNPVGMAAGYDKNCLFLDSLLSLGFGYVVGGTVTASHRAGNPRPRILRNPTDESLVNALAFPSWGVDRVAKSLERRSRRSGPIFLSIAGTTDEEFLLCHSRLEPLADAIELNISSPNTAGLRVFQEVDAFKRLIDRINNSRTKPLFIKLPPYFDDSGRERVLSLVRVCVELGVEGVTASNTRPVPDPRLKLGKGGLSGRPIFQDMLRVVREVAAEAAGRLAVNACGGIFEGKDAWQALKAGATTVQLLTGLIYQGPGVARAINQELLHLMKEEGIDSLASLRGASQQQPFGAASR